MIRILCATFFALSLSFGSKAEIHWSTNGIANSMGIGGTVFKTWGLNYRRYFNDHWGLTGNVGGWFNYGYGNLGVSVGGIYTLMHHSFNHSKALPHSSIRINAVAYVAGIYGHGWSGTSADNKSRHYFDLGLGVGPGAEFFFNRHFAVHAELPWMTFFRFTKEVSRFDSSHPHFGGGVNYYF